MSATETAEQKLSRVLHAHVIEVDPDRVATHAWPQGFTMSQLQSVHEARGKTVFNSDTFRRQALKTRELREVGISRGTAGRPATMYVVA